MSRCFFLGILYNSAVCLLALAGLLLIGTSTYMWLEFPQYGTALDLYSFSIVGIVVGGVALLLALLMLVGMCCQHRCMMYTVALLSTLVVCFQLGATLWIFTQESDTRIAALDLETYTEEPQYVDNVQAAFGCCGVEGPGDWADTPWGGKAENAIKLPTSCCGPSPSDSCAADKAYVSGCRVPLLRYMEICYDIVLITSFLVLLLQLFSIILSCCVARALRERAYEDLDNE